MKKFCFTCVLLATTYQVSAMSADELSALKGGFKRQYVAMREDIITGKIEADAKETAGSIFDLAVERSESYRTTKDAHQAEIMRQIALIMNERASATAARSVPPIMARFISPSSKPSVAIDLMDPNAEDQLASLVGGQERHLLSNQFGLTPARRLIILIQTEELTIADITSNPDFNGFMITVSAILRHMRNPQQPFENPNVHYDPKKQMFSGYVGNTPDPKSIVTAAEVLDTYAKIKGMAS